MTFPRSRRAPPWRTPCVAGPTSGPSESREQKEMAQRAVSLAMAELKPVVAFTGNFQ